MEGIEKKNRVKHAENNEHNMFLSLFENSINAIILGIPDGTVLEANGAALEMFGYSLEELRSLGRKTIFDHKDPGMVESLKKRESEGKAKGIIIGIRKNGERFPCEFSSAIFYTNTGERRTSTVLIDITERRKAEDEMELLINNTEEGFVLINKQYEILSFNKQFGSRYENLFNRKIIKGDSILDFVKDERREKIRAIYERVFKGEIVEDEIAVTPNDQPEVVFSVRYKPALDHSDNVIGAFVTSRDISEKIAINQEKEYERKDKEALINSTEDLIWSVSKDFLLIAGNSAFIKTLNSYSGTSFKAGDDVLAGNYFPEDFILFWKGLYERALKGESVKQETYSPEEGNASPIWFEMNLNPIFDEGQIVGVACFGRNITDKKNAQFEREQIIAELSRNNADLKQFSYVTSHNLRAPIANLLGLTSLVDHYEVSDPSLKQILDGIKQSALMFDETVKDLSKVLIIKDQSNALKEAVSLEQIVDKTFKQLGIKADDKDVKINCNFTNAPLVTFTASYLESVFMNLFTNAFKYRSNQRKLEIEINSVNEKEYIVVTFRDNGIGIDLEKYGEKMFKLYQRFHENSEGKGLGLYLVKSQLEALGSTIDVESEVGKGTNFILKFKKED